MARAKQQTTGDSARLERIRREELGKIRDKARSMAVILAKTKDPAERYCELLHNNFGLTAAQQAQWGTFDDAELMAQTVDRSYALWLGKDGPRWIREHYQPSAAEVRQIAREELEKAERNT